MWMIDTQIDHTNIVLRLPVARANEYQKILRASDINFTSWTVRRSERDTPEGEWYEAVM